MLTKIMKWVAMAALFTAAMLWRFAANSHVSQFLLACVVCLGAIVVATQAGRARKYLWAGGFAVVALLFNPLLQVFPFGWEWGRLLMLAAMLPFAGSLAALKTQPILSMPSITDLNPGSESL